MRELLRRIGWSAVADASFEGDKWVGRVWVIRGDGSVSAHVDCGLVSSGPGQALSLCESWLDSFDMRNAEQVTHGH